MQGPNSILNGGGNHRSSIFRSHVGAALLAKSGRLDAYPDWEDQSVRDQDVMSQEAEIEAMVSGYIASMPVLCVWEYLTQRVLQVIGPTLSETASLYLLK